MKIAFFVFQFFVGLVLLWTSTEHMKNNHFFLISIVNYDLFSDWVAVVAAFFIPVVELILAILLLSNYSPKFVRISALILFLLFGGVHATALLRGLEIDCGCFGPSREEPVTVWTMAVNFGIAATFFLGCWVSRTNSSNSIDVQND